LTKGKGSPASFTSTIGSEEIVNVMLANLRGISLDREAQCITEALTYKTARKFIFAGNDHYLSVIPQPLRDY
jgi:hypothetical protein